MRNRIVVVGAGQAAVSLVAGLRAEGHDGPVTVIGAEPEPPYQRPPLSKKYLLGEMDRARLPLKPESWYAENGVELRTGARVAAIDRAAREVALEGGERIGYARLALTTGSVPRRLPKAAGGDLGGVHTVRTLADIDRMAPEFTAGRQVAVVGGGWIGLEAAATAAQRGLKVVVVEAGERILQRVAAPATADFIRALHRRRGVEIREGVQIRLEGETRATRAILSDGTRFEIDFAVVGVGVAPDAALAEAARLEVENGIRVDAFCRSSDPNIYAAGDCANFPWRGGRLRLESVPNAVDQGENAARNMLGRREEYIARPWFWSDQYEVKLQIAGLNAGWDDAVIRPGAKDGARSVWYFRGGDLLAVDAMDDARAYMVGKRLIESGRSPSKADAANPEFPLRELDQSIPSR